MVVMFRLFDFDSELLAKALKNTFKARKFELPFDVPICLTSEFYEDQGKPVFGTDSRKRAGLTIPVGNLNEVVIELRKNLLPILALIAENKT